MFTEKLHLFCFIVIMPVLVMVLTYLVIDLLLQEEELKDIIEKAREMEDKYGHFFDMIIINNDTERAYHQLLAEINSLEREPQWVPAAWVKAS